MPYRAADIARALGLSKATVSLALNGRPGVSAQTKQKILQLKQELEQRQEEALHKLKGQSAASSAPGAAPSGRVIKLIIFSRGMKVAAGDEIDLWSDVNAHYAAKARELGFLLEVMFFNLSTDSPEGLQENCCRPEVAGVILSAGELQPEDRSLVQLIRKPLVLCDADLGDDLAQVQLDNWGSAQHACNFLLQKGCRRLLYVRRGYDIYNYALRRASFAFFSAQHPELECTVLECGNSIAEIAAALRQHLETDLPDGILAESFHGTIGALQALRALQAKGLKAQPQVAGIDAIPEFAAAGFAPFTVTMPHVLRASWAVELLLREIAGACPGRQRPKLIIPSVYPQEEAAD